MIYLIVGGSCCGKTSFVKNSWLKDRCFEIKKELLYYTETDSSILLGKYNNIGGRERSGTDTISRSQIHLMGEQVERLISKGKDIILEGDKATSRKLFNKLLSLGEVKLILIRCETHISIRRNSENNSTAKESTLKASLTKAINIFREYRDIMSGVEIDTSSFSLEDFKRFSINNIEEYNNNTSKLF